MLSSSHLRLLYFYFIIDSWSLRGVKSLITKIIIRRVRLCHYFRFFLFPINLKILDIRSVYFDLIFYKALSNLVFDWVRFFMFPIITYLGVVLYLKAWVKLCKTRFIKIAKLFLFLVFKIRIKKTLLNWHSKRRNHSLIVNTITIFHL